MADSVAGVVLAAGAGHRLAPLSRLRPKALCPVGGRPLVDLALDRLRTVTGDLAVNAHRPQSLLQAHVTGRAHLSIERGEALGTAGAIGALRDWIAGRPVLLTNADAWLPTDLDSLVEGWDGERVRLLTITDPARADFGDQRYCGAALMPWAAVRDLQPIPSGLYEVSWGERHAAGTLELVGHHGPFVDCGTPADYLAANLVASGGRPVIGPDAVVGRGAVLERSVVWPGSAVAAGERLVHAIRADGITVLVR